MNLARIYLAKAYPDLATGSRLDEAEAKGLLNRATELMGVLAGLGRPVAPAGTSVVAAAREQDQHSLSLLQSWRDELAEKLGNPSLSKVEVVLTELSSPQAVTAHEQDKSNAVGIDRRLTTFLGAVASWAYFATGSILKRMPPVEAQRQFLVAIADQIRLCYLNQGLPDSFEDREIALLRSLNPLELRFLDSVCAQAMKFVFYHELAHVHLEHFSRGHGAKLATGDSGQISAFAEHEIEYEADLFASQQLRGPKDGLSEILAAKIAPHIFFEVLALKEALLPATTPASETLGRLHPASRDRAARLKTDFTPPGRLPPLEVLLKVPEFLQGVLASADLPAVAKTLTSVPDC